MGKLSPEEAAKRTKRVRPYQWKPGQSGNPTGIQGKVHLAYELQKYLHEHPEEVAKIIESLVKQGKLGNIVATKEMFDRLDGKVTEIHRIEGELPIRLVFVPARELLAKDNQAIDSPEVKVLNDG